MKLHPAAGLMAAAAIVLLALAAAPTPADAQDCTFMPGCMSCLNSTIPASGGRVQARLVRKPRPGNGTRPGANNGTRLGVNGTLPGAGGRINGTNNGTRPGALPPPVNGTRPGGAGNGTFLPPPLPPLNCTACDEASGYELRYGPRGVGGCACRAGYGRALPDNTTAPPPFNTTGPPPPLPPCVKCAAGLVSGPDAPKPLLPPLPDNNGTTPLGGRRLLQRPPRTGPGGPARGPPPFAGQICVPCPDGTVANAEQTACV